MKITEEDLKKLFEKPEFEEPGSDWGKFKEEEKAEPVKIKKFKGDELKVVRKQIKIIEKKIPKPKKESLSKFVDQVLKFTAVSGFCGFAVFGLMNWSGYSEQVKWVYFNDYLGQKITREVEQTKIPLPSPTSTPDPISAPSYFPEIKSEEGNYLKIDKISISPPIMWDVKEEEILDQLQSGVVHYLNTSHPGEGGNIFIVGHSSNYFWIKSEFNNIFALLDKVEKGDRIEIRRGSRSYFYDVTESKVVKPDEVEVLYSTQKELLTLMTCWPVGTSLNRLIVHAEYVYSSN